VTVRDLVEAVLLDSSGEPEGEARQALHAVVRFAVFECGATSYALHAMLDAVLADTSVEWESTPFAELPLAGAFCAVCFEPHRRTPGGAGCPNGHGGAPGTDLGYEGVDLALALAAALLAEGLGPACPLPELASSTPPMRSRPPIDRFVGRYSFLSNFAGVDVQLDGATYPSVEAAYQAAKTTDARQRAKFTSAAAPDAKKMGRRLKLRPDWESVKVDVMAGLLRQKFALEPLRGQLLATGDAELVEGNYWGDTFWGVCQGVGENWLGRLLMQVRAENGGSP
jgi:ribA/ribD-fused uncharacterized protein